MQTTFPIWDRTGTFILCDEHGDEIWLDEAEARLAIGRQLIGVDRQHGKSRKDMKLYLKSSETQCVVISTTAASHKRDTASRLEAKLLRVTRRVPTGQPNCVRVVVGDTHRVYMHHAERCQSYYDSRVMPVVRYRQGVPNGTPHIRASHVIDASCL